VLRRAQLDACQMIRSLSDVANLLNYLAELFDFESLGRQMPEGPGIDNSVALLMAKKGRSRAKIIKKMVSSRYNNLLLGPLKIKHIRNGK
jgi:hypothetical protein